MYIESGHAVLDVTKGRTLLADRLRDNEEVWVMVIGRITSADKDDGVSTEFILNVDTVNEILKV